MKRVLAISVCTVALLTASVAQAACYADYKAKKDSPLRLHYGVLKLPDTACDNPAQARKAASRRVAKGGWTLLNVVSVFGEGGLDQRRDSAGEYFLRY